MKQQHLSSFIPTRALKASAAFLAAALACLLACLLVQTVLLGNGLFALANEGAGQPSDTPASETGNAENSGAAAGEKANENGTPKSEVVYARLASDGAVEDVYVVNSLEPAAPGTVTDYGAYESVQNLTDTSQLKLNDDSVTMDVEGTSFSYQGNLGAAALPWNIAISATVDGQAVSADDLGGTAGDLALTIDTTQNTEVDPIYFENYLMQIAITLPQGHASKVSAPDGQVAMAGADTQVTFMAMPGKDGHFTLEAAVSDFSLPSISFAAVPLSLLIESPDTDSLVSGFDELGDGVDELAGGASKLADGVGSLASGLSEVSGGASSLASGANELAEGIGAVVSGLAASASGLQAFQQGLFNQAASMEGSGDAQAAIEQAASAYSASYSTAFASAYAAALAQGTDAQSAIQSAATAAASDPTVASALSQLTQIAAQAGAAPAIAQTLNQTASSLGSVGDPTTLLGGLMALSDSMPALQNGAQQLASGTGSLADGAASAASGADALASGSSELASGTSTLSEEVRKMPDKVQDEIDAMLAEYDKSDFVPVSFTSPRNTNVELVQFVFSTAPINAPEPEAPEEEPAPEPTLWDRFLALF